jgi:hypothetical protein
MMHKKRGYKRDLPQELMRDYKLFAIACEGIKREPEYFNVFQYISSRIKVDIIDNIVSDFDMQSNHPQKSAPKWVLDRAVKYIDKEGLLDEDELWFVMDIDRWSLEQLREIATYCNQYPNWHIVLSNPCFEVWLYFHKKADIKSSKSISCQDFKNEISQLEKGGYHSYKFIPNLHDAIHNAKTQDSSPDHFMPALKETKVYQLGEALIKVIGKNDFEEFLKTKLPELVKADIEKAKKSKRDK